MNAAIDNKITWIHDFDSETVHQTFPANQKHSLDNEFLVKKSKTFKKKKGIRSGIKKIFQSKWVQKLVKRKAVRGSEIPQWLYIGMSVFFLGWLAMGILDDWTGRNWWIALILYGVGLVVFHKLFYLSWLAGFLFSMIKMGEYY